MYVLGINAAFHDSAAVLIKDGRVIAAVEEERFNRVKHAKRPVPLAAYELPFFAIDYCLSVAEINLNDVDYIAYSYDPRIKSQDKEVQRLYDPQFIQAIIEAPQLLATGVPLHLRKRLGRWQYPGGKTKWVNVEHHMAHAASAFYPSPYEESAILTMDGRGEMATTTYSVGRGNQIERIGQVDLPHSLGILYERVTEHLGFLHSCDEGKVMAMAAYGKPRYQEFFRKMIKVGSEGKYAVSELDLTEGLGQAREGWEKITARHYDIAASLQLVLEESVLKLIKYLRDESHSDNLCLAGGVFLNCTLNSAIRDSGIFENVWVQPAAGDAGSALGAALWLDTTVSNNPKRWCMENAYWGSEFSDTEIEVSLKKAKVKYRELKKVATETAAMIAEGKVLAWFQGRMEFGPRALGNRSILADPRDSKMRGRLNEIKGREEFRPVAPVVLEEAVGKWFGEPQSSPFMLFTYHARADKVRLISSAIHTDGTARIQTINPAQNQLYYELVREFGMLTGVPMLINTSFNVGGEPIVENPEQALRSFFASGIDTLVIGSFILEKN